MVFLSFQSTLVAHKMIATWAFQSVVLVRFYDQKLTLWTLTHISTRFHPFAIKEFLDVFLLDLVPVLNHILIPQIASDPFVFIILRIMSIPFLRDVNTTLPAKISAALTCHFVASIKFGASFFTRRALLWVFVEKQGCSVLIDEVFFLFWVELFDINLDSFDYCGLASLSSMVLSFTKQAELKPAFITLSKVGIFSNYCFPTLNIRTPIAVFLWIMQFYKVKFFVFRKHLFR